MFKPSATSKKFVNNANVGNFVEVGGSNIHYMIKGSGEPILFIHGIGQSLYTWRNNFNELSARYKVILLDLPGFGCSEYIDMEYCPGEIAEFIKSFLDAIGIRRVHIAAFSEGGIYALAFAQKHPTTVDRMILVSPGGLPEHGINTWSNMLYGGTFTKLALSMLSRKRVKKVLYESYFDKTCLTDEIVDQHICFMNTKEQKENLFFAIATMEPAEILANIRHMNTHVLILSGSDNPWRYKEEIDEFAAPFQHSYVSFTRNCGHLLHEEKPEKFNSSVVEFLEWNLRMPGGEE